MNIVIWRKKYFDTTYIIDPCLIAHAATERLHFFIIIEYEGNDCN